jgi:hypothetical protein
LALQFGITNNVAKAMADAFTTAADAGTAAVLNIYDGAIPTDADTALGAQVLLAQLTFNATSFGAATDGTGKARITANAITSDTSADATGTAAWFRILTQSGGTVIAQGSVGTGTHDFVINTTSIVSGATVACTAFNIDMPEQ